jgi:iron complex transport system substrate-binding protein
MRLKKYMIPILFCVLGCMLLLAGCGKSDSKKEPETKTVTVTDCIGRGQAGIHQALCNKLSSG